MTLEFDYCSDHTLREYFFYIKYRVIDEMKNKHLKFKKETIIIILNQLLDVIDYLHKNGIICRELIPENIFISNDLKSLKLGLPSIGKLTQTIISQLYTSKYDAPDEKYSEETDIWSLGIILYEICKLKLPFKESKGRDISECILSDSFEEVIEYGNNIKEIINGMLKKKSIDRSPIEIIKMSINYKL